MSDPKMEQLVTNIDRAKSIESVQVTKSGKPGESLQPLTPVARRKRWRFVSLIALILLGTIAVIVFVPRSTVAGRYEGLGAALCVIGCGGLLVRHTLRVFTEQDKLEEEQLNANQAAVSPSQSHPAGQETNLPTSPTETGQDIK